MSGPRPDGGGIATALPLLPRAACIGTDPAIFFGPDNEKRGARNAREAKARAICARCPERAPCLEFALGQPDHYGYWGGVGEEGRRYMRRRMLRRAADAARRAA